MVMQESNIGRLDHYFLTTVVKLFSEIQQLCVKLQDKHESEVSSSITLSVHRDSTQSVTSISARGLTRSSMISSVHDPDLISSLESLSFDFMQRSRGLHDGTRRSIMILGEPGMSKVPLILTGAEATRRVSLTLDPNILNLIRPRSELSEQQESEATEDNEEQQIKVPVPKREKKPPVPKTNRTRRK
ncbi:hypothetical protein FBUS_02830 [Fasciolopsis buskii]|uniref:Uncharacterized protein n=1 Tax=Fasciolopsis buskii TaxID=27845 RepID=A0A8E0S3F1_9TREM|nr:hypothetical protein FBUS_02830 [Fasciolopsis buski]